MPSLIDYAVLGLLIERPSNGEELYERFVGRFGELLPASRAKVDAALERLEREGLIAQPSAAVVADRRWGGAGSDRLLE